MSDGDFARALALIDEANAADPQIVSGDGGEVPHALLYSQRMTRALARLYPGASEPLKLAVRAQHIERWTVPRDSYPMTRVGYLRWRKDLMSYHARRCGELMAEAGYGEAGIARVQALLRKEKLKADAEAQALEDTACIVFLEDYFADFAPGHDEAKVIDILRKTWAKMSETGHRAALELELAAEPRRLVEKALSGEGA